MTHAIKMHGASAIPNLCSKTCSKMCSKTCSKVRSCSKVSKYDVKRVIKRVKRVVKRHEMHDLKSSFAVVPSVTHAIEMHGAYAIPNLCSTSSKVRSCSEVSKYALKRVVKRNVL